MKLMVRTWLLACLCFAVSQSLQPEPPIAYAQANDCPGCCNTWDDDWSDCPSSEPDCNNAEYHVTAASPTGAGLKSFRYETRPCDTPNCGSAQNVPTSVDNPWCCDRDGDGYNRPGCGGGTDCNDDQGSIHPGAAEHCGDDVDNNCNGLKDCLDSACYESPSCCGGVGAFCYSNNHCCGDLTCGENLQCEGCDPGCEQGYVCFQSVCAPGSPIVIDILGNGFNLTNGSDGVSFDLDGNGQPSQISWTARNSDDAWVVLDRNGNGQIDNGLELFGNFTPQPEPPPGEEKHGFLALAVYDKPSNGGNGDNMVDKQDAIFASLRLWRDTNHNGRSESSELFRLRDLGLKSVNLDYKVSGQTDESGNRFRYRAKVQDTRNEQLGRWAWDVFLVGVP